MGLVGTESGDIALINLNTGQRLGSRKISGSLSMLHVCHDNSDSAYLLVSVFCSHLSPYKESVNELMNENE